MSSLDEAAPAATPEERTSVEPDDELDALVWHALTTAHRRFAEGSGSARRYDPDVAAFVAIADRSPAAWHDLAELVGAGTVFVITGDTDLTPPDGWVVLAGGDGAQMIRETVIEPPRIVDEIVPLDPGHVTDMLALVELTQPGPFRQRTIELGHYVGVFESGRLIAMAGRRMETARYTEVSAVCTHPDARGRGLAAALTHHVASGIAVEGRTPILHVAHSNPGARRVYDRLGFVERRTVRFLAVRSPSPTHDPTPEGTA